MSHQFKDVEFLSAKDKSIILKQWITFIKNGFKKEHFTDRLYKHLILHCSFIAHFNRDSFYSLYFKNSTKTKDFVSQFDIDKGYVSTEYGSPTWALADDYHDINSSMVLEMSPYKEQIYIKASALERTTDLATARSLLLKHGIDQKGIV